MVDFAVFGEDFVDCYLDPFFAGDIGVVGCYFWDAVLWLAMYGRNKDQGVYFLEFGYAFLKSFMRFSASFVANSSENHISFEPWGRKYGN